MSAAISSEEKVRELVMQQSADWFVANRAGLSASEREEFASWLKGSPLHVEEYLALASIDRDLRAAGAVAGDSIETIVARARSQVERPERSLFGLRLAGHWQVAGAAMAGFAVVCLGVLLTWNSRQATHPGVMAAALHFTTRHGEQQTYRLADSSVLHLNTDSAVTVRYSDSERRVTVESGEADFEVVHQAARPFRVIAGAAEAVDVGTRFDVRIADGATRVIVQEGQVAVALVAAASESGGRSVMVGPDQQITVAAGALPANPIAVDARHAVSWLQRQIVFDREPLAQVAAEFSRYAPKPIQIASPGLRDLEISGVFATDDSEAFVAFLRSLDNVQVEETTKVIRVSQK
jgi:transmembrane sensor